MKTKVGINGFGRIGKAVLKVSLEKDLDVEVVAINSGSGPKNHSHIFEYDSIYGKFPEEVKATEDTLVIGDKEIKFTAHREPSEIPWKELGVEIVIESTGVFLTEELAQKHIKAGAKTVILSAPAKAGDVPTFVMGVNEEDYDKERHQIVSNASCTTNCLAPVAKVLEDEFGIEEGLMTTVHAFTNDQNLLDNPHKDLRRARAANESIIPTTTGAAKAVTKVIPSLEGKLDGMAMRVPVPVGSVIDLTVRLKKDVSVEEINEAFVKASEGRMKGILGLSMKPLVSTDYIKNDLSSTVDGLSTMKVGKDLYKVISWYDNEWGYSSRLLDLANYIAKQ